MSEAGAGRRPPVTVLGDDPGTPTTTSAPAQPGYPTLEARLRNGKQAAARQKALTRLKRLYPKAYELLYQEELSKLGVADHRPIGRPPSPRPQEAATVRAPATTPQGV